MAGSPGAYAPQLMHDCRRPGVNKNTIGDNA